jgi:hypothetical protein
MPGLVILALIAAAATLSLRLAIRAIHGPRTIFLPTAFFRLHPFAT